MVIYSQFNTLFAKVKNKMLKLSVLNSVSVQLKQKNEIINTCI